MLDRPLRMCFRWLPFLLWVTLILALFRPGAVGFRWVSSQPWGDKVTHVLLIGTLAFLFNFALANRRVRLGRLTMPLGILVVALFMTGEEVSQLWIPGRSFDGLDLLANYLGIGLAWLAALGLLRNPDGAFHPSTGADQRLPQRR